jgi:hypothetical protein
MGIRVLRADDIGMSTFEVRRSRSMGLLRRFRYSVENSDWDERFLECVKWIDGASLVIAGAAALCVLSVVIRMMR